MENIFDPEENPGVVRYIVKQLSIMEIPSSYLIRFKDDDTAELLYQGEVNGVHKWVAEYQDRDALLKFGEKSRLTLTIETKFLINPNSAIFKTRP